MPTLFYSDLDGNDRAVEVRPEGILVGRGLDCQVRIDDPRMSRRHARFFVNGDTIWVEDLGSSNGVYVGFDRVQSAPVAAGELVVIGSVVFQPGGANGAVLPAAGVHATLSQWLQAERKARATLTEERVAFAQRVAELHERLAEIEQSAALGSAAVRQRDAAIARGVELDSALAKARDQLLAFDAVRRELDEARDSIAVLEAERLQRSLRPTSAPPREPTAEVERLRAALSDAQQQYQAAREAMFAAQAEAERERQERDRLLRQQSDWRSSTQGGAETVVAEAASREAAAAGEAEHLAAQRKTQPKATPASTGDESTVVASDIVSRLEIAERLAQKARESDDIDARLVEAEARANAALQRALAAEARADAADQRATDAEARAGAAKQASSPPEIPPSLIAPSPIAPTPPAQPRLGGADVEARLNQASARILELSQKLIDAEQKIPKAPEAVIELAEVRKQLAAESERRTHAEAEVAALRQRMADSEKRTVDTDNMAKVMAKDVAEAMHAAAALRREVTSTAARAQAAEEKAQAAAHHAIEQAERLDEALAREQRLVADLSACSGQLTAAVKRAESLDADLTSSRVALATAIAKAHNDAEALERIRADLAQAQAARDTETARASKLAEEIERQRTEATAAITALQQQVAAEKANATNAAANASPPSQQVPLQGEDTSPHRAEVEQLTARMHEAAELAAGRTAALQRQLDEAIAKLARADVRFEGASEQAGDQRVAAAEERAATAERKLEEETRRAEVVVQRKNELADRCGDLEQDVLRWQTRHQAALAQVAALETAAASARALVEEEPTEAGSQTRLRLEGEIRRLRHEIAEVTEERDHAMAQLRLRSDDAGPIDFEYEGATTPRNPTAVLRLLEQRKVAQARIERHSEDTDIRAEDERLREFDDLRRDRDALAEQVRGLQARIEFDVDTGVGGGDLPAHVRDGLAVLEDAMDSLGGSLGAADANRHAAALVARARAALRDVLEWAAPPSHSADDRE